MTQLLTKKQNYFQTESNSELTKENHKKTFNM